MNKISEFNRPFKAVLKQFLSYRSSSWNLHDYPIEFRKQKMLDLTGTNLTMYPWEARIVNWYWMNGDGSSKKEAYLRLEENFEQYKSAGKDLPRPGTKMEVMFANVSRIDNLESEAIQFFNEVLDMNYLEMFISDESSLYDFCWSDILILDANVKINKLYGIHINDIEGLRIVDILERIKDGTRIT
ncbi:hypothetical protein A3844_07245 [Paenibacillus helianthi]|uniref:Uncharacterized protein n=1 Tax=Paenibacillus helianthi TaxID=1349432 RepID=A0ABX3EUS1_9BACL|nr:hypothetical protein [Paenibacillus helianthi]OKP88492.1 hypothetical protein A3844_07245 [Paenibacillus helianthi]